MLKARTWLAWALDLILTITLMIIAAIIGALTYNGKPIRAVDISIATHLCKKNDGVQYMYRSWLDSNKFNIKCNDTALYLDVAIHMRDQLTERKDAQ